MDPDRIAAGIPAKFVMISGSEDKQTSADVFNVGSFDLPHTAGKAGGACTSTLLKVLNENPGPMSWLDLLHKMRDVLRQKGYDQVRNEMPLEYVFAIFSISIEVSCNINLLATILFNHFIDAILGIHVSFESYFSTLLDSSTFGQSTIGCQLEI